ncbi:sugar ABC transporter ATP-binding protein [Leucobacter sp. CSA1]|uniref:Sugar ABC transporter ATP-binding protein n=1 Tax=Leucobacter chromiisoli TaxID=2796471 RepID=A0A934UTP0_9MICO|nr:sugar ABC transporter ATP-binding protein [Leucobacter chromiisoli]MBK0418609.1 sugar ABC transporter ATP-binding protein [Leucobacter chromiisoli]
MDERQRVPGPRLVYDGVTVDFGATRALSDVSLSVAPGEIIGLLGHNGAGKSTLFNVTSGALTAFGGSFAVDGKRISRGLSPREAAALGITVIHQEPALVANLSVFENLFLARDAAAEKPAIKRRRAEEALASVGAAHLPLDIPVDALSLGERQLVDLARGMLAGEMKVLLLDEPTAALGRAETDALHQLIRSFAARGTSVLYVSHRLPDIMEICTRMVVMRGGAIVVDGPARDFTPDALARALVPELRETRLIETTPGDEILRVPLGGGSISVRHGEVVGLFGMAGGEQFRIAARLAGADHQSKFEFRGRTVKVVRPAQAIRRGIFYVPPDRDAEGLIASESAKDNVMLPWYGRSRARGWWVSPQTGKDTYAAARTGLEIHGPSGEAEISQFSGGNRQKHLLARWLYPAEPELLVLSQPTQGVDVGARVDIVDAVRSTAAAGSGVLVVSSESDEIAMMCDRAYVLFDEEVREVSQGGDYNADLLSTLLSMAGARRREKPGDEL